MSYLGCFLACKISTSRVAFGHIVARIHRIRWTVFGNVGVTLDPLDHTPHQQQELKVAKTNGLSLRSKSCSRVPSALRIPCLTPPCPTAGLISKISTGHAMVDVLLVFLLPLLLKNLMPYVITFARAVWHGQGGRAEVRFSRVIEHTMRNYYCWW